MTKLEKRHGWTATASIGINERTLEAGEYIFRAAPSPRLSRNGATLDTLERRKAYGGRKGRRAAKRLKSVNTVIASYVVVESTPTGSVAGGEK